MFDYRVWLLRIRWLPAVVLGLVVCYSIVKSALGTPTSLGEECCKCWRGIDKINNEDKKIRETSRCYNVTQSNMRSLREMGMDKDWSYEQVEKARREFDRAYDNCK